jgi:hypothetical protein
MKWAITFITLSLSFLSSLANTGSKNPINLVTHKKSDFFIIKTDSYCLKDYVQCNKTESYLKEKSDYTCSPNNGDLINYALYLALKNSYLLQEFINKHIQDN